MFVYKHVEATEYITQDLSGLKMQNFQGIIFK